MADQKKPDGDERPGQSLSVFIREDEIFTGEEAVFTMTFKSKKQMQEYFPKENISKHEFFIKTDYQKPAKTRIIVRIVNPDTNKILVLYAVITKKGSHPRKPEQTGIYYKIIWLDPVQIDMIYNFIA